MAFDQGEGSDILDTIVAEGRCRTCGTPDGPRWRTIYTTLKETSQFQHVRNLRFLEWDPTFGGCAGVPHQSLSARSWLAAVRHLRFVVTAATASHRATRAPSRASSTVFGIDVDTSDADIGRTHVPHVLSMVKGAGATAVRFGGNWNSAEPSPGVYNFSAIDQLLTLTRSDDLTLLFRVGP